MHRVIITLFITFSIGVTSCDEQGRPISSQERQASVVLSSDEEEVIAALLQLYSFGEEELLPPALSSHIGIGHSGPQNIDDLQLDYHRYFTPDYLATLAEKAPEWLIDPEPVISEEIILKALQALTESNKTAVNVEAVAGFRTVPVNRLNSDILKFTQGSPDEFWEAFDSEYSEYAGFSTVSRVGFSTDRTIALVYFSWTGGPTLGLGAVHILEKQDHQWNLLGRWQRFGWTS